jgi:hypothetical protein
MKRWALILIGSVAISIATWALFFRGSDEDAVRATLKRAAEAVKVKEGENPCCVPRACAPSSSRCSSPTSR